MQTIHHRKVPACLSGLSVVMSLLTMGLWASHGAAQVTGSFEDLPGRIEVGNVIVVENETGIRLKGRLQELSDSSLSIRTLGNLGQQSRLSASQVTRVSKVDSRLSGFLIGLGVAAVPGAFLGSAVNTYCSNETGACPGSAAVVGAIVAVGGGWIGWAIDGAIDGETLAFDRGPTRTLHFAPTVTPTASALTISLEF